MRPSCVVSVRRVRKAFALDRPLLSLVSAGGSASSIVEHWCLLIHALSLMQSFTRDSRLHSLFALGALLDFSSWFQLLGRSSRAGDVSVSGCLAHARE